MSRKEKVTKVVDGDTFMTGSRKRAVRLANVNAPEPGSLGAASATQALRELIQGQTVSIGKKESLRKSRDAIRDRIRKHFRDKLKRVLSNTTLSCLAGRQIPLMLSRQLAVVIPA